MPLVQTRGAASAQGFGEFAQAAPAANYIEDVFSTYLYTGTGSSQTITNNIDLSGKGGLVWQKRRSDTVEHLLYDTTRGALKSLSTNDTNAENTYANTLTAFGSTGFTLGSSSYVSASGQTFATWTFREQPKFFDVVTYTGNGSGSGRTISHNLGSAPGMIILKVTNLAGDDWYVYHRSIPTRVLALNSTNVTDPTTPALVFGNGTTVVAPTSTEFTIGSVVNPNTRTFVAYLFAHDAGGFGTAGTDNVISCGSYTGNGSSTGPVVTLGYEPQWLLIKRTSGGTGNWFLVDNMRGLPVGSTSSALFPNTSGAEDTAAAAIDILSTGFQPKSPSIFINNNTDTYIYIAIRRGPMKTPTSGTQVFAPVLQGFDGFVNTGFVTDLIFGTQFTGGNNWRWVDRLRGGNKTLSSNTTSAESTEPYWKLDFNNGVNLTFGGTIPNWVWSNFRRAPGFFDVVCYTGTGSNQNITHNLGAVPELMIVKIRNGADFWAVYASALGGTKNLLLNTTADATTDSTVWNNTNPTSSVFTVGTTGYTNAATYTYVAYLFATVAGVSKVGSYTGTGTTQTINCGFTAGSRFVMIKRTDSTGDWYVWDSARGINPGNDPYLLLNSTAAEVTNTDYVDTASSGFEISSTAPAAINANGGSFIFLAIA